MSEMLSAAGEGRREVILGQMARAMNRRVRRRKAVRGLAGAAVLAVASGAILMARGTSAPRTFPVPAALVMQHASFEEVPTRTADELVRAGIVIIGDEQLLDDLSAIGKPTGIIRTAGQVRLTSD